ncbi:MAG: DUF1499 domain-containing protein [Mariniblastus sp.]
MENSSKGIEESSPDQSSPPRPNYIKRVARRLALFPFIVIAGLYLLSMTAPEPNNLGATGGQLAKCPDSPNCVSTQADDETHRMEAIPFAGNSDELLAKIKSLIESEFGRAKLITESEGYLRYEFKSLIFRFIDDVEFLVDHEASVIHFRSASRVGHSDMGKNRKRMQKIAERLKQ